MKKTVFFLILFAFISSCSDKSNDKKTPETVVKTETVYVVPDSLKEIHKNYLSLKSQVSTLQSQNTSLQITIAEKDKYIDSLKNVTPITKIVEIEKPEPKLSKNEIELRKFSKDVIKAWDQLAITQDQKTITHFFLPTYRANRVSIDHDNTAQISIYTEENFDDYINWVMKKKKWSYTQENIKFLDIEVKDDLYFNSSFKYKLLTYEKDKLVDVSTMLITITGKKINSEWKIANYSWVRFSYM